MAEEVDRVSSQLERRMSGRISQLEEQVRVLAIQVSLRDSMVMQEITIGSFRWASMSMPSGVTRVGA